MTFGEDTASFQQDPAGEATTNERARGLRVCPPNGMLQGKLVVEWLQGEVLAMARSTIALLGTLRELHAALPGYDWRRLAQLVAEKRPDLLCVEIDRRVWEADVLEQAPIEVREVLASLSRSSEITLIPLGAGGRDWAASGVAAPRPGTVSSLRRLLFRLCDRCTVGVMKLAGHPPAVNSPLVEHLCATLCDAQVWLADRQARRAWLAKNEELLEGILWTVRRDPGRRVLVALDCRRKHWLSRRLESTPGVTLVDFGRF